MLSSNINGHMPIKVKRCITLLLFIIISERLQLIVQLLNMFYVFFQIVSYQLTYISKDPPTNSEV